MASLTQWTWVWVNSGSWWWTGKPGMLQSMGSQKVGHDWATELNHAIHYIPRDSLFYNWKFVPFDHSHSFCSHLNPSCLWQSPVYFVYVGFFFQIPHISEFIQYLSSSIWFISLNVMPWRFIHSVPNSRISFFCIDEKYYVSYFLHSFIPQWTLELFSCLAIVNNAAVNLGMQLICSISDFISFRSNYKWDCWIIMVFLILIFWGNFMLFSIVAAPISFIPTNNAQRFFLHIHTNVCCFLSFWW